MVLLTAKREKMHRGRAGGFTLIELLVVIAIIAILAAIVFPVFVRAKESAIRGTCQTHQKELYSALMMYTNDYGKLPWLQFLTYANIKGTGWVRLYHPYVKNDSIILCPQRAWSKRWKKVLNQSYAYNQCLLAPLDIDGGFLRGTEAYWVVSFPGTGRPMGDIKYHSRTPVFFDAFPYHTDPSGQRNGWGWQPWDALNPERMTNPHRGGSNYVFLDGHVRWMLPEGKGIYMASDGIDYDGNGTLGTSQIIR